MERLKVGVLGVGHLGTIHATLYRQIADAELVGIYDVNVVKNRSLAKELKCTAFDSAEALLDSVDAVSVVTPTTAHYAAASMALERGKHVFIEKPITHNEENAAKLIELARSRNLVIQVGHIERFNPAILALEDVDIRPLFIEAHRLASFNPRGTDVAVILDLMIHDIDLILHLVNSKLQNVEANGVGVISSNVDIANARLEFENGSVANITASRLSQRKMRKMRIFQKNAYISMDFIDGVSEIFYIPAEDQIPFHDGTLAISLGQIHLGHKKQEIKYNRLTRKNVNPLKKELNSFVVSVLNDLPPVVDAADGLAALKVAHLVMRKIEQQREKIAQQESPAE